MQTANHEDLKHVIYVSRPTHFDHMVLDNILITSRSNNLEVGVTGNLICHSDLFLQMLEGPPAQLNDYMRRSLLMIGMLTLLNCEMKNLKFSFSPHGRCEMTAIKAGCYRAVR